MSAFVRLRAWLARLGVTGVAGLGVLAACAALWFSALRPAERELAVLRAAAARAKAPIERVAYAGEAGELRRFHALFPPAAKLADELERLYALAREAGLELQQGEYRVERRPAGPIAYRVTLPVRGGYAQVRALAGAVLTGMPTASLDALRFERKKSAEARLDAQLRLTLYFRPAEEAP